MHEFISYKLWSHNTFISQNLPFSSFLHQTGLIVSYDLTKPVGSRVLSVEVKCSNCSVPDYEPLQVNKVYKIIIPTYLAGGGDRYRMISENKKSHITGQCVN